MEEASPEPVGAQVKVAVSQESPAGGLHTGECEKRAREMLGVGSSVNAVTVGPGAQQQGVCLFSASGYLGSPCVSPLSLM